MKIIHEGKVGEWREFPVQLQKLLDEESAILLTRSNRVSGLNVVTGTEMSANYIQVFKDLTGKIPMFN